MGWGSQIWGDGIPWGGCAVSELGHVRANFVYRLENIEPASSIVARGFECVDRLKHGDDATMRYYFGNSSGRARDFVVTRLASDEDRDPSRSMLRQAVHHYEVAVAYPTAVGTEDELHAMMDRDRSDIIEALRPRATYNGTWNHCSTRTGIKQRIRLSDVLDDSEAVWVQAYQYKCRVSESI